MVLDPAGTVKYHRSMTLNASQEYAPRVRPSEPQARLLAGMAAVIGRRGYAATTIADVVAEASVSKRTFYEHFQTKAECLLALYEAVNLEGLGVLAGHIEPDRPWRGQVEDALTAYFEWMSGNPMLMRSLFVDVLTLGPPGFAVRRRVHERIAAYIVSVVGGTDEAAPVLSHDLSAALVGGIHELVLAQSERGEALRVDELARVATEFVCRVLCVSGGHRAEPGLSPPP